MKRFGSIYLVTNVKTGQRYVGQTIRTVESRFNDHCRDNRSSRYLSSAIKSHGREMFQVEELFICFTENDLNEMETYFINHFNTLHPNGYNLSLGGHNRGIISEKTRNLMRDCKLGKSFKRKNKWSNESRLNNSKRQGGKSIIAENIETGEIKKYDFINQAVNEGFSSGDIYRVLKGVRKHVKGFKFYYNVDQVNQSGSSTIKNVEHAQRIGFEPAIAE